MSVLNHLLAEASLQVAQRQLMSCDHFRKLLHQGLQRRCLPQDLDFLNDADGYDGYFSRHNWLKVVTDIDDTLVCSGNHWPAGVDGRYAKGTPYPGLTAFLRELHGGDCRNSHMVALSARPHIPGDVMEDAVFKKFRILMKKHGLHAMPALLTGSLDTSFEFLGGDMAALGRKKLESFEQFMELYPEFKFIFVGDNGQADYAAGLMMCRKFPHNVEQVWIHAVKPLRDTFGYDESNESDDQLSLRFFEDYVLAAIDAVTRPRPLITPEGLKKVALAAVDDFKRIAAWPSEAHRAAQADRLGCSIREACEVLRRYGVDDSVIEVPNALTPSVLPAEADTTSTVSERLKLFVNEGLGDDGLGNIIRNRVTRAATAIGVGATAWSDEDACAEVDSENFTAVVDDNAMGANILLAAACDSSDQPTHSEQPTHWRSSARAVEPA